MRLPGAEIALSVAVLALGAATAIGTLLLPAEGGYARIGPNFVPGVVAAGLLVVGAFLLYEALAGGWRHAADGGERSEHAFAPAAFAWVSAGLLAQMALIHSAGFVVAGAALFACVARAFGSRRYARDAFAGALLALGVFLFFVHVLNVNLPGGWIRPLLGGL